MEKSVSRRMTITGQGVSGQRCPVLKGKNAAGNKPKPNQE